MSSVSHNQRAELIDRLSEKAFGARDLTADEMFADLVSEGRSTRIR